MTTDRSGRPQHRRLFVPLAREPYGWFLSGAKRWEVRRQQGTFALRNVTIGRRVELRRGYRDFTSSIWGTVTDVVTDTSLTELLHHLPLSEVVPNTTDYLAALRTVAGILRIDPSGNVGVVAFRISLDGPEAAVARIRFTPRYRQLITQGNKTTTVRRGQGLINPGPAVLCFNTDDELPAAVTAVVEATIRTLTGPDALRDGFAGRDELLASLRDHYPDLDDDDPLTIMEFKWST